MNNQPVHISSPQNHDLVKTEIKKLFIYQLSEVICLEHHLYEAFQEITEQAKCLDLKLAMREHELETANHYARLKEILALINNPGDDSIIWPILRYFLRS